MLIGWRNSVRAALVASATTVAAGCAYGGGGIDHPAATAADEPPMESLGVTCTGKCDGLDRIDSLWQRGADVSVDQLLVVGAGFATDGLNDALARSDYGSIRVGETALYVNAERAAGDPTLGNLDGLTSGLAARFGERELTTEVNNLRRDHLRSSDDSVFAESSFRIGASLGHNWGLEVGGLEGGGVSVGFDAGTSIEARTIQAFPSVRSALVGAPLAAAVEARGFVLPRSMGDVRAMKPGESFALRGEGHLGANVGVGVPLLIANPSSVVTYSIVLSGGVAARIAGNLDVQLVRLSGDQVVVDVGIDRAASYSAHIAIEDGWGIPKLARSHIRVGSIDVAAGQLLERALVKKLESTLGFSARAEHAASRERVTVARLRFSLDSTSPDLEQALAQALKGDVRLGQALANRGDAGVIAELDLVRTGTATTSYAGLDLLGMKFYRDVERSSGSAVVQTPGGARALLFESLHRESGWFFSSHGFTRVGLSGMTFDPRVVGAANGEANLFLQVQEGDEFMERDKMLDHLDALIVSLAGTDALAAVEGPGNELERLVKRRCTPTGAFDPCLTSVLRDPEAVALREGGQRALEDATTSVEPSLRELVLAAGRLRLTSQATREYPASLVGPPTSIVVDYRLDNATLERLLAERDGAALRAAIVSYLRATNVNRGGDTTEIAATRADVERRYGDTLDRIARKFDDLADRYQRLLAAERAEIEGLGPIGSRAVEIRFAVDRDSAPDYSSAVAVSLAERRSQVAMQLFDELRDAAGGLGPENERVVAYGLLALTPRELVDLRLDVKMNLRDTWSQSLEEYRAAGFAPLDLYVRGSSVAPIDGGVFSIDALTRVQRR